MTSRPCSSRATAPVGSRDVAASVAVSRPRHCNQTWARTPSNVRGPSASHRTGCGLARQLRVLPRPQNASSRGPRAFPAAKKGRAGLFRNYYEFLVPKRCYPQKCPRPPMRAHGTVEYSPKRVLLAKPGLIAVGLAAALARERLPRPAGGCACIVGLCRAHGPVAQIPAARAALGTKGPLSPRSWYQ